MLIRISTISIFSLILLIICNSPLQAILINEIMPSNYSTISDMDGEYNDWFEIYNNETMTINLDGYGISDDNNDPYKWIFPELQLMPDQYLLVFASDKDLRGSEGYWETIIDIGDEWRYMSGCQEIVDVWKEIYFNDSNWETGTSGIGYGDNDDNTIISNTISLFMRKSFTISDLDDITGLIFNMDYDDGYVAYLNGTEIARENMTISDESPYWNTEAIENHEALIYQNELPPAHYLNHQILQEGENVLAVQVHNFSADSDDLTAIPFLTLQRQEEPENTFSVSEYVLLPVPELHTNFKLNAEGETLMLTSPEGDIEDYIAFGSIPSDISFGRNPETNQLMYFDCPTPGSINTANGASSIAGEVNFSLDGGFYNSSVIVALNVNSENAVIHYTTDGSVPCETSPIYLNPILINENRIIRARAFGTGLLPGKVITNSYLINISHDLPVVSLSTAPDNLFDPDEGIYTEQNCHEDWERPIHIELFEPNGAIGFSADAGVKIFGGVTREYPQKSLAIYFRDNYGTDEIDYQIFPNLDISGFKSIVLRNGGNDFWGAHFRDGLMTGLTKTEGIDAAAFRPAVVYINGQYWGIQNIREKINEDFLASHYNLDPDNIDMLQGFHGGNIIEGDNTHYLNMLSYISANPLSDQSNYEQLGTMLDIDNFLKYQVVENYFCNTDWPGNNVKLWRPQTPEGKWRCILYDTDFGFGLIEDYDFNMMVHATNDEGGGWQNPPWSTFIFRNLLENDTFKRNFINTYCDYLNTIFKTQYVLDQIQIRQNTISSEIERYNDRWFLGSYNRWLSKVEVAREFAINRPAITREDLREYFGLSEVNTLTIHNTSICPGKIKVNNVLLDENSGIWSGSYFPEIPLQLEAIPSPGTRFVRWSGIESNSTTIEINLSENLELYPVFEPEETDEEYIIINEINYNPADDFDCEDWIELYNISEIPIDISDWYLCDSDDEHVFILPENTIIEGNGYLVLSRECDAFREYFPDIENLIGDFDFGLSGSGEEIRLFNSAGELADYVEYSDSDPWPEEADGEGPTLELRNFNLDNSLPQSWAASIDHGTPGAINSITLSFPEINSVKIFDYKLAEAYPNPFNPFTKINYSVPHAQHVNVSVYNIQGQMVKTLYNGISQAGEHQLVFNGQGLSSGTYFYKLESDNFSEVKKCYLLK